MKLYKLKHLPTGLFYTPSKGSGNLSSTGKIYNKIPDLKWCEVIRIKFCTDNKSKMNQLLIEHFKLNLKYFKIDTSRYNINTCFKTNPEEWEIIELQ